MEKKASDSYLTIVKKSEGLYKEKGSKFIAKVLHIENEDQFKEALSDIKKEYYDARHHCYAYRLGPENEKYRSNDDGEPSGTAGKPILNQIYSYELFNVLVVVVRYFGGTKLGVSGLINAYKSSTREALNDAIIVKRHLKIAYALSFNYPTMNNVMKVLKEEKPDILNQDFSELCVINIEVKKNNCEKLISKLSKIRNLEIKAL